MTERSSPPASDLWERRSRSFGAFATEYAEHRPDYAAAAVAWALAGAGRPVGDVLDLGAGTGLLTQGLVALGVRVTAVEPDEEMLAELGRRVPDATRVLAPAEEIPLPDGSVDAVVAGTAFHWFDRERALGEIVRVLRPGGVLATLYNADDESVPWVVELDRLARTSASSPPGTHDYEGDWIHDDRFEPTQIRRFAHRQPRTVDSLTEAIGTHSHTRVVDDAERAATLARVRSFLGAHPATAQGQFDLPLVTVVGRARRPAPPRPTRAAV